MGSIGKYLRNAFVLTAGLGCLVSVAGATENGASIWPFGCESIAIANGTPRAGQTTFYEYTNFYEANQTDDAHGMRIPIPDFKLRVFAVAGKLSHNWGIPFLGGQIGSWVAVPYLYEQLHLPGDRSTQNAVGNVNLVPFSVFYHRGIYNWYYEVQFETAGSGYQPDVPLNIGQHNVALTPAAAFTIAPHRGLNELSARFDYVINDADHSTHYHSGNEFMTQFDARKNLPHTRASIGVIGYFYQQVTNDKQNGATVVSTNADGTLSTGFRGRTFDLGPQISLPIGEHGGMAFKWDHDMLVQNKSQGNAFWFQFAVPFGYLHHPHKVATT